MPTESLRNGGSHYSAPPLLPCRNVAPARRASQEKPEAALSMKSPNGHVLTKCSLRSLLVVSDLEDNSNRPHCVRGLS